MPDGDERRTGTGDQRRHTAAGADQFGSRTARRLPHALSRLEIAGGAVHDTLVGLAALEHNDLATRDARVKDTYEMVGAGAVIAG